MIRSAPALGSHDPADVSHLVPVPVPVVFTHRRVFFIMKVPVRYSVARPPLYVACELGPLEIHALPSIKIVPLTVSFLVVLFQASWPLPLYDLQSYDVAGVRSIAADGF